MNNFKALFMFDTKQQKGLFVLICLLSLAIAFYAYRVTRPEPTLQLVDTSAYQVKIDSLQLVANRRKDTIYPFNPNYITDYRGYKLGLSTAQLDRLFRFRESGKWVNSAQDFKTVTQVDQRWLDSISPYFKFPEWVTNAKSSKSYNTYSNSPRTIVAKNINAATQEDITKVYGIGPAISGRIVKERERLNGFLDMMQVRAVYGMSDSTMVKFKEHFYITAPAGFKKVALNTASQEELSSIPYINDYLASELIKQRTLRDGFKTWDKVILTSRFPEEKLALIQLYLTLD
jgi:DNA uptake protein ComE-like DNA-binding protein